MGETTPPAAPAQSQTQVQSTWRIPVWSLTACGLGQGTELPSPCEGWQHLGSTAQETAAPVRSWPRVTLEETPSLFCLSSCNCNRVPTTRSSASLLGNTPNNRPEHRTPTLPWGGCTDGFVSPPRARRSRRQEMQLGPSNVNTRAVWEEGARGLRQHPAQGQRLWASAPRQSEPCSLRRRRRSLLTPA